MERELAERLLQLHAEYRAAAGLSRESFAKARIMDVCFKNLSCIINALAAYDGGEAAAEKA